MPRDTWTIGGRVIGEDEPAYVIAEVGNTHNGSVDRAIELITVAAACGADAVKFQRKCVRALYTRAAYERPYPEGLRPTYGAHKEALELPLRALSQLQRVAEDAGITWFATAFDEPSATELASLDVPVFKVHSGGLKDSPLLRHLSLLNTPVLLSTGGGTEEDIQQALRWLVGVPVAILQCTAAYPVATTTELNLRCIETFRRRWPGHLIGWSAHDVSARDSGINHALVAYGLGARIIEKHFTLDRELRGGDHQFALGPRGLKKLVDDLREAHQAGGDGVKRAYPSEGPPLAKMTRTQTAEGWRIAG